MDYKKCKKEEATHVKILVTNKNKKFANGLNITVGKIYGILRNKEVGFEGEETIKNDNGTLIHSFNVSLDVDYVKENLEER